MSCCECCPWASPAVPVELVVPNSGGRVVPALREDWLFVVSSRRPKAPARRVYTRLTADAVAFYEAPPPSGPASQEPSSSSRKAAASRPLDVVLLANLSQLLGRAKDSDYARLVNVRGDWWELRSDPPEQISEWVKAISGRLEHFRQASRVSTKVDPATLAGLAALDAAAGPKVRSRPLLQRLAMLLPCSSGPDGGFSQRVSDQKSPYRGDRMGGHSNLVQKDCLAQVSDPDLQEAQAAHWSEQAVRYLKRCEQVPEELALDFSLTLRFGVPDGLKRLVWPLAVGEAMGPRRRTDPNSFYANLTKRAFGGVVPAVFQDPVPTFCQGIQGLEDTPSLRSSVKHLWLLTPNGETVLRRLLWVTQLTSHIEFCPFLPNLFATLLAFFSEAEAMLLVNHMISEVERDVRAAERAATPRIILTRQMINKQAKLFVREGKKRHNAPEAIAHLEQLGLDMHAVAVELLQDGCAHSLPFRALCRVVGSFLKEGSEVILRYALALLKLRTQAILACATAEKAKEALECLGCGLGDTPEAIDSLTKAAYSIVIREHVMSRVSSNWGSAYVAPKRDYNPHIFCRPRLFEPRGNCPDELWEALWSWVPPTCRIFDPRLIYVPSMHGTSLRTCLETCSKHRADPMIFFMYTQQGDILGGFSPKMWVRTHGYIDLTELNRPVEDAFVFRKPRGSRLEVFIWSGANELLLEASEASGLTFGGDGAALSVSQDLIRAHTKDSVSFASPALLEPPALEGEAAQGELEAQSPASAAQCGVDFDLLRFEIFALA